MKEIVIENLQNFLPSRFDKLVANLSSMSRSKIQSLIKDGNISIDGKVCTDNSVEITEECKIVILYSEKVESSLTPKDIDFEIIYEDADIAVINKPAGLTVHPGAGNYEDTLVNGLLHRFGNLSDLNTTERPGIVHRLDRDTTGVMVVAKNNDAHIFLSKQIEEKTAKRTYICLVWGLLKQMEGIIDINIGRSNSDRTKMTTLKFGGKSAITEYKVIDILYNGVFSLVECRLQTGRTHQIRVHMSHIGHSIVGDQSYGSNSRKIKQIIDPVVKEKFESFKRQALHSYKLSFTHPRTHEEIEFTADIPKDMKNLLLTSSIIK
jgi:23S rRNA pseudouridine1911/1915/1917 synthase